MVFDATRNTSRKRNPDLDVTDETVDKCDIPLVKNTYFHSH